MYGPLSCSLVLQCTVLTAEGQQSGHELSRWPSTGRIASAENAGRRGSGGIQRHYSSPSRLPAQQSAPAIFQIPNPRIYTRDPAGTPLPAWQGSEEGAHAPPPMVAQGRWASVDTGRRPRSASAIGTLSAHMVVCTLMRTSM